jgi:glycosyltransferase involved in cell wall biosynthesis
VPQFPVKHDGDHDLPRLAYVADVNVQDHTHGSLQLFRLLSAYPPEKLQIIETTWNRSAPERRITGVSYRHHRPWWTRVFHQSRLPGISPWLAKLAVRRWREIEGLLSPFQPEALLTVAHGFSWLAASELAQHARLPLHLIVHDNWPRHPSFSPSVSIQLDSVFRTHYRLAASRMCVSASMEEAYRGAYDVPGAVLYPMRSVDLASTSDPPARLDQKWEDLTVAFAGTLHPGQIAPMRIMADVLQNLKGRLLVFGPATRAELDAAGLSGPHIELRGMLPSANALLEAVRQKADLLYAPLPFDESWRGNASLGFPSKLTDYTAAALPILIHGPSWSSAVRWARHEPASSLVVDTAASEALEQALHTLQSDPALRVRLARGAAEAGRKYFSAESALGLFRQSLLSSSSPS